MVSYIPESLSEALKMRQELELIPYGGGTDLMVEGNAAKPYLFLHRVPELKEIRDDGTYIRIGSECTFTQIQRNELVPPLLREAVSGIAAPAIRNLGTIGGNVGNGSAKADSVPALFVLGAAVGVAGTHGFRLSSMNDLYLGRKKLDIKRDELIVEFLIPKLNIGSYHYHKIGARKALAISRVSFAGEMVWESDRIMRCSTAFGAINDTVFTRPELDALFHGKTLEEARNIEKMYIERYADALAPQKGRISSEYRKTVCMNELSEFVNKMLSAAFQG